MKRGSFTRHGSSRTTFSGTVEREDAQPNESLVRKRTTGPPALKPAAPPPTRSHQNHWGHSGNRGRPWARPANQKDDMPLRTVTDFNSAGPSRDRYQHPNASGSMTSGSTVAPPRGQTRSHEEYSQFHNKRRKTTHESANTLARDIPQHFVRDSRRQYGRPSNAAPLSHQKQGPLPRTSRPLPTPSSSRSPSSPYLSTQPISHNNLPVPPLPSRKRQATTSSAPVPPSNAPSSAILSTSAFQQHPQFEASTIPYRVPLPTSILPALRQMGIIPVPWTQLPPPDQPQPIAVLWHEKPDGKWVTLEINMSLVHPSQAGNLANLLNTVTAPRLLNISSHPPPLRFPIPQIYSTSRYEVPRPNPPHIPVPPPELVPQFIMRPLPPPTQADSPCPLASSSRCDEELRPSPASPHNSPAAPNTQRIIDALPEPPWASPRSPTTSRAQPRSEPPPLPSRKSPTTPLKIKTEPPSTPSLFCCTPLPPSSTYRPGEIVREPRRLVKQACTRYMLPEDCHADYNPRGFQNARRAFFKQKRQELKSKGLNVEKKVVLREDGLVLEWTSPVPVWTDTFLPEAGTDLASALNETSLGNARAAARNVKQGHSSSRAGSASRLHSTSATVIVLDHSPPPSPKPTPPPSIPPAPEPEHAEEPETASSRRIVRPSQVIPPNPHPPKRIFKPVHVPRTGASGSSGDHPSHEGKERERADDVDGGQNRDDDNVKDVMMDAGPAPLAVLTEPVQPTPLPSPAPAPSPVPVPANTTNIATFEDGGLEYIDEPNPEDIPPKVDTGDVTMEPPPSPAESGYGSSASMDRVMESLTDPTQTWSREASPQVQASLVVKEEESETVEPGIQDSRLDFAPATLPEAELDNDGEGSEGSIYEGDDILELARQFLLRYIDTFDHDRGQLEDAYSPDSTFSISIHEDSRMEEAPNATTFCTQERVPQRRASTAGIAPNASTQTKRVYRGREDIVNRLCSLGPHKFLSPRLPHAHPSPVYDIVAHPFTSSSADDYAELVLASLHSEAVNTTRIRRSVVMDHIVTVDQNFVLKLRDHYVPEQGGVGEQQDEEQWPLVIVSHQMVVRDGPMMRQEDMEDELPWVAGIRAASAAAGAEE